MSNNKTALKEELRMLLEAREYWQSEGAERLVADIDEEVAVVKKMLGESAPTLDELKQEQFSNKLNRLAQHFNK